VFNFISYIWSSKIIRKPLNITWYFSWNVFRFFLFSFDHHFIEDFRIKKIIETVLFGILKDYIVSGWFSWIYKNWRRNFCLNYFGMRVIFILYYYSYYQIEFVSVIIIWSRSKFQSRKIHHTIFKWNFRLSFNSDIN
jgi:hypothetical protein